MSQPLAARSVAELRARVRSWHSAGLTVGFVPTMGALHEGHLALVRQALEQTDRAVVSIFVNPTQFAPSEDLDRYPRDEAGDLAKLATVGTHLAFMPAVAEMYPDGACTWVEVEGLSQGLCAEYRPVHFRLQHLLDRPQGPLPPAVGSDGICASAPSVHVDGTVKIVARPAGLPLPAALQRAIRMPSPPWQARARHVGERKVPC